MYLTALCPCEHNGYTKSSSRPFFAEIYRVTISHDEYIELCLYKENVKRMKTPYTKIPPKQEYMPLY